MAGRGMLRDVQRGYGQYCPIAKAAEILAERWTPLIIRNLMLDCHRFGEILEGCPHMSTSLLTERLRTLERDGVVTSVAAPRGRGRRYYLTPAGEDLAEVVLHLGTWGARWLEISPRDHDPFIALWSWARQVDVAALPPQRVVIRFEFADRPRDRLWLLLCRPRPEVCITPPGPDEHLVARTDVATLIDVQRGYLPLADALVLQGYTPACRRPICDRLC
ncbi:MAG: helix-turn-helix transcriptional regulator [Actinobacteria bacterium]|nr:helix-turn-helix transcriptional regulator [Actinomycetota bacterium]